jgi:hypothetical protein
VLVHQFRLDKRKKLIVFVSKFPVLDFQGISSSVVFITPIFFKHVRVASCWVHPMMSVDATCAFAFSLMNQLWMMSTTCEVLYHDKGILRIRNLFLRIPNTRSMVLHTDSHLYQPTIYIYILLYTYMIVYVYYHLLKACRTSSGSRDSLSGETDCRFTTL